MEDILEHKPKTLQEELKREPDENGVIWITPEDIPNLRERLKSMFAGGENLRPEMR